MKAEHAYPIADARQVTHAVAASMGRRRWLLVPSALALVGAAACGLAIPFTLGRLVDVISAGSREPSAVVPSALLMTAAILAGAALGAVGMVLVSRLLESALADLREQVVEAAFALPQHRVEQAGSGDLVARAVDDVSEVAEAIPDVVPAVSGSLFTIALTLVAMAALDPWHAVGLLVVVPVHVYAVRRYLRSAPAAYAEERTALTQRAQRSLDALYGLPTLRAYRLASEHQHRIGEASWGVARRSVRSLIVVNAFFARLNLAEYLGMGTILCISFWLVEAGETTVGTATTAMLLFLRLFAPMNQMLFVVDQMQSALASMARIVGVTTVVRPEEPARDRVETGDPVDPVDGVVVRDLSHRYDTGGPGVLHGIDLRIAPGERLAIVGASGAGKSTLAALVAGVHVPTEGSIECPRGPGDLVLVTQEVHVFDGTVRDNLTLAHPMASDAELWTALAAVGADDLVSSLESGLDTQVGAGGVDLTPAIAQLLALARVQLIDPRVVVLDEATAEAGSQLADHLDRAADAVLTGRTAIVVTHRLSQVTGADRIAVLDAGRLVEVGPHQDLLDRKGTYARLWHGR